MSESEYGVVPMKNSNKKTYIKAIAEIRSISAAAEMLGITQPALSAYLKKIETELGAAIFDRSSQPLELTDAGRIYIDYLDRSSALKRELLQNISDLQELKTGSITIGGASFFNVSYLPEAVAEFASSYSNVDIEIVDGKVPELSAMAQNGLLDLFITPSNDMDDRFIYEELCDERILLCVPEVWKINDELSAGQQTAGGYCSLTGEEFRELCSNTFITLKNNQDIGRRMELLFRKYGCRPARTVIAEQTVTTLALTAAGVGISMVATGSLNSVSLTNLPVMYYLDDELCRRKIYIAYPKNKYLSGAASEMVSLLKEINAAKSF